MEAHEYDPPTTQSYLDERLWELVGRMRPTQREVDVDAGFRGTRGKGQELPGVLTADGLDCRGDSLTRTLRRDGL